MIPQAALALMSGGIVGLSLGATGGGGSLIAIPLLVYVLGVGMQEATAMSLVVVAASALLGVYDYHRSGEVRFRAALVFSSTGALGAWMGAYGHQLVREDVLLFLFGLLMVIVATRLWRKGQGAGVRPPLSCADQFPRSCWIKAAGIGSAVGILSGVFGIGGGFVIVPALTLLLGFPLRIAIGTSLLIIALVASGGILGHLQFGGLNWNLTALLLLGSAAGMVLGTNLGRAVSSDILTKSFAVLASGVGLILLLHNGMHLLKNAGYPGTF